jgi:hypothetical protein
VRLDGSEEEEGEEGQVADPCKERMGGSPSLRRYFLSLFWKRFRRSFSLEVLRQALSKMAFFFRSKRAPPKLDFQEVEGRVVRTLTHPAPITLQGYAAVGSTAGTG